MLRAINNLYRFLSTLRIEEVTGIIFLAATILPSLIANLDIMVRNMERLPGLAGGFTRALVSLGLITVFLWIIRFKSENRAVRVIRDFAPFLLTILIYLNLHDMIRILNPHDFHDKLITAEEWIFGFQPTVWIEQFYHPRITDWFSFSYLNYYWLTLSLLIYLYRQKRYTQFRTVVLAGMVSNYIGFFGYIIFPAASPYMVIPEWFTINIWEGTSYVSDLARAVVSLSPERVRDAFPSLHNSITLMTMIMAWRYNKVLFWVFFPMAVSLPIATVYLRYHFVVDIFAGFMVTFLAIWLAPILESKWRSFQKSPRAEPLVVAQNN